MADYLEFYEAREIISGILEKDFVGPVTKDECLTEIPVQYYIMGKLYPRKILLRNWISLVIRCWKTKLKIMMLPFL